MGCHAALPGRDGPGFLVWLVRRPAAQDDGSQGYGYQTWMGRHGSWRAIGASNQLTLVVPDCDVVVAVHASIGDENGFNSLVYQLCDTMSDKKLKPAKGFDLNDFLAQYALKMPFAPGDPAATVRSCTRTAPGELSTYLLSMFNVGADETFRFRFGEDGSLSWTLVAPKGRGGAASAADITLTGTLIRTTERTTPF